MLKPGIPRRKSFSRISVCRCLSFSLVICFFRTAECLIRWINYQSIRVSVFIQGTFSSHFSGIDIFLSCLLCSNFYCAIHWWYVSYPSPHVIPSPIASSAGPSRGRWSVLRILFWSWTFEIIQCKCIAVWILGLCWLLPGRSRFNGYEYEWWWNSWSCHDLPSHTMSFQKNDVGRRNVVMCCGVWCLMFIYY